MFRHITILKATDLLKSKYTRRWRGKDMKWHYDYNIQGVGRSSGTFDTGEAMRETAQQFINVPPEPIKINPAIRKKLNKVVAAALPGNYYEHIPLEQIDNVLRKEGYLLIQEDNTEWSGMLLGADAEAFFGIGKLSTERTVNGLSMYSPVSNSGLRMTWYQMSSGKYEIVKYIT